MAAGRHLEILTCKPPFSYTA